MGATLSSTSSSPTSIDGRENLIKRNNTSAYNHLFVTPGNSKNKNNNFLFDSKNRHLSLSSSSSMLGIAWNFAKKTTTGIPNKEKRNINRLSSSSSVSSALSKSHDSAASLTFNSSFSINSSNDQLSAYSSTASNSSSGDSGIVISRKGITSNESYLEIDERNNNILNNICPLNTNEKFICTRKKESILSSRIMSVPINNIKKGSSKVRDHILAMTRSKSTVMRTEENGNMIINRDSYNIENKFKNNLKLSSTVNDYDKKLSQNIENNLSKPLKNVNLTNRNNNSNLYNTAIFNFGIKNDNNVIDKTRKRTIIQASTTELLKGVSLLITTKCSHKVPDFFSNQLTMWLRSVDRSLIVQGWQDIAFLNPANMVFFFMLLRSMLNDEETFPVNNLEDLQMIVFTCLFISYSYMGNEISYPLKPFISQQDRSKFWDMCVQIVNKYSGDMLQLNTSATFFTQVFSDLKNFATIANN
ncbi:Cdk5 activator-like protein [Strongyloides ratti]|uniref:Cdk5 activator-like protein n=1 Tax=Strongyloides ratti TaxID=34506 RepID=A0A090LBB0_STRRB|nr:Cdk5 activator-like protein [Strongyloides ratti]CEF65413.1 Cdk5 activator-like protein [Strongyloides ratti]